MASDETGGKIYMHNAISLGTAPPTATAASSGSATPTATPAPGTATATPSSTPIGAGGTRLKDMTFENGSLTDPSSGADAIVGTVSLQQSTPLKGLSSASIPNVSSGYLREDFTGTDELFVSFYMRVTSFPATARLALISNGGTSTGSIYLNSNRTLTLRNGGSVIGASSPALTAGTLYRIGLHQKKGSGGDAVLEAFVASGDAAFGAPFASSATQSFTTQATRFSLGATNSNAVDVTVDDIRLDSGGMP
jgi:hypothetical protein